jgi:1-acyl-sn-glycerol-3-phosphate acyltransferase
LSLKKSIDQWALNYWILQHYVKIGFRLFFRRIELVNLHKIPKHQPVIIAPNHQNALIDALALVCNTSFQPVFMARADIFRGNRLIRFLTFLNIMPIYRIRDGIENVKKNDAVFDKTTAVLHNGLNPLVLFAEGNHGDKRRLRPLVKGLFRIAFQAQEKFGTDHGVKIVPLGIDYGHYQNFRSTLLINVGDPIDVADFYQEYAENPVQAINRFKEIYAEGLSIVMIDIQTETYYDLYMNLRVIYNKRMTEQLGIPSKTLEGKFKADKEMIRRLNGELENNPNSIEQLNTMVVDYLAKVRDFRLRDWVVRKGKMSIVGLLVSAVMMLVFLPVFLFGFLHNIVPYWFTGSRGSAVKDPQFISSFKLVIGVVVFPVWYIIVSGVLAFLSLPLWLMVLYVVLMPVTGLAAFEYHTAFKKLLGRLKFSFLGKDKKENLQNQRNAIIRMIDNIMNFQIIPNENSR